jgi:hypothetical protein
MTGMSVDAGIYSTSTGQSVIYERDEIAGEWKRLKSLPQGELTATIAANRTT